MTKETRLWVKASKAWMKTQQLTIDSCDLNIRHAQEQIKMLTKIIYFETLERSQKVKQLKQVEQQVKKVK